MASGENHKQGEILANVSPTREPGTMNFVLVVDDSAVDRSMAGHLLAGHPEFHVEYASNGIEALELLEARLPLAVITDIQMPEMDGFQLVEAIHRHYPSVPMIVMTAHGSEETALQALSLGAADYVPKAQLAAELRKSLDTVLALATGERGHQRLWHCLRHQELQYELENDVKLIPPLVDELQQVATQLGLVNQNGRVRLAKSLFEVLRNAIYHGNLELSHAEAVQAEKQSPAAAQAIALRRTQAPYCDRRVHVRAVFSPQEARFIIRDEGPGFDVSTLPNVKQDPSHLSGTGGRGLVLTHMFMDEVSFNPVGNEVTLVKRAPASA
jgi:CheY-like chemotaxis protein